MSDEFRKGLEAQSASMHEFKDAPSAATTESRLVECSYCGRTVETFNDPERGQIMFGHRAPLTGITSTPRSEWPWCVGGGRNV